MVVPAIVFMASAVLQGLQPSQYEPAHTSLIIFEWFAHMPGSVLGVLLIGLPLLVVVVGCLATFRVWHGDAALRRDGAVALSILRRHLAPCMLVTSTVVAGVILTAVVSHLIAD